MLAAGRGGLARRDRVGRTRVDDVERPSLGCVEPFAVDEQSLGGSVEGGGEVARLKGLVTSYRSVGADGLVLIPYLGYKLLGQAPQAGDTPPDSTMLRCAPTTNASTGPC